ncbi:MAG: hypothetical protein A2Y17_05040 [Clostridiales bacterium GWF2_38_85]|nr:MAG: hypothetical protein A2Y17_05040 [Clostridiales bacterium GWF2_38_85]HBL84347.1 hypothetical protein [Clostridiales bacterium]
MSRQRTVPQNYVFCPICGKGKIIMEDPDSDDVPLRLILPKSKKKAHWYIKCTVCKSQIGIAPKN